MSDTTHRRVRLTTPVRRIATLVVTVSLLTLGAVLATALPTSADPICGGPTDGTYIGSWTATSTNGTVYNGSVEAVLAQSHRPGDDYRMLRGTITFVSGTTALLNNLPIESDLVPPSSCETVTGGKVGDPSNPVLTFSATAVNFSNQMTGTFQYGTTYTGSFAIGWVYREVSSTGGVNSFPGMFMNPSPTDPTQVTVLNGGPEGGGPVAVGFGIGNTAVLSGYATVDRIPVVRIFIDHATAANPAQIFFAFDASVLVGRRTSWLYMPVFRNGVPVPQCGLGEPPLVSPRDPCESERRTSSTGDVFVTIQTTHSSVWVVAFATVPSAPRSPSAAAGKGRATVKWRAPAITGGPALTGYTVTPYLGTVALAAHKFNSAATKQTITGLTKGKSYKFKVAARNVVGTGPKSVATKAVIPR